MSTVRERPAGKGTQASAPSGGTPPGAADPASAAPAHHAPPALAEPCAADRPPILRGRTVWLRPPERSDIPLFVEWLNDARVARFLAGRGPLSTAAEERWFEQMLERQGKDFYPFVICLHRPRGWDLNADASAGGVPDTAGRRG